MNLSRFPGVTVRVGFLACVLVSTIGLAAAQKPSSAYIGRSSCGASTCHGNVLDRGPAWRSSVTRWSAEDPHAGAGLVLLNPLSTRIVEALLNEPQASDRADWSDKRDGVLRQRCISCHATASPEACQPGAPLQATFLAEGVSCESCHGAAGSWVDTHYSETFVGPERFASGLRNNETVVGRGQGCVRCHVGSRTEDGIVRDMNHDIIAAGHPVLRFDLSLYDAALPRHWDTASSPNFYDSPMRVRKAGRATTLAAAARLAAERAAGFFTADQAVPLPELSDYDCFACHQALSMDQYRLPLQEGAVPEISAGLPSWNSWHMIGQSERNDEWQNALALRDFSAEKAKTLAKVGNEIAALYGAKANEFGNTSFSAKAELTQALANTKSGDDWHAAAVNYLDAEAALRELAINDERFQSVHERFVTTVRPFLRFKDGFQSPSNFDHDKSEKFAKAVEDFANQVKPVLATIPE